MPTTAQQLDELKDTVEAMRPLLPEVDRAAAAFRACLAAGNKVLACGNGGSAADAMHLAEELTGRYSRDRRSLPGISLAADATTLTCIANDYGFDHVFSRQVEGLGKPGDFLAVFSTSGNSPSILNALAAAKKGGLKTFALLGKDGGKAKGQADFEIVVPARNTARIQELHTWVVHVLLEQAEDL
jgi:D-sedoheptulose 7-phosphate isomerase